jgi:hypothetical protein
VQFKIGTGATRGINTVRIDLGDDDLYVVTFYKIGRRALDCREMGKVEMVEAANLRAVFTSATGFECSLGTMGR